MEAGEQTHKVVTGLPDPRRMNLKPAGGSADKTADAEEAQRFQKWVPSVTSRRRTEGAESKQEGWSTACLSPQISSLCGPALAQQKPQGPFSRDSVKGVCTGWGRGSLKKEGMNRIAGALSKYFPTDCQERCLLLLCMSLSLGQEFGKSFSGESNGSRRKDLKKRRRRGSPKKWLTPECANLTHELRASN